MLWQEKFAFGITIIDEQHKELFRLIEVTRDLIKEASEGIDCYDEIKTVLRELESYTIYHFEEEEELLEKINYAYIDAHKEEHSAFVAKVHETLDSDLDYHQEGVLIEIYDFLIKWISNHVLSTDSAYVSEMKEKL
jgi:hemerythrin